jgi:LPS export ABC transporter protein LptC
VKRARGGTAAHGWARRGGAPLRAGLGVLACGVLAACSTPDRGGIATTAMAADSADQYLWGMTTILTKNGVQEAYLSADTAYVYEAAGRVDLRHVKVTFYSAQGDPESVLTGKFGTYWTRTNQMSARDDVIVVRRSDGARLRTDFIEYDPGKNEVRTDTPYAADKGQQHIEGVGFVCDPSFTVCSSQQTHGTAGRLVMPSQ